MSLTLSLGRSPLGAPVTWQGGNGHIAVLGQSGRGKSVLLRHLMAQLPPQGVRCLVFDCAGDFREAEGGLPPLENAVVRPVREMLRWDPFRPLQLTPAYAETAADTAARLAGSILDAYAFRGTAQPVRLRSALAAFLEAPGGGFPGLVRWLEADRSRAAGLEPSLLRLRDLARIFPGGGEAPDWGLDRPGITVLTFDTVPDRTLQAVLTELLLAALWSDRLALPGSCPLVVVLDECQRFSFREDSMLTRILREGRKFGVHGWFASQWLRRKSAAEALEQAALRIWFYPGEDQVLPLARRLAGESRRAETARLIRSLRVGRCLFRHSDGSLRVVCVPAPDGACKIFC